jgi:hypothetical protein
LIWNSSLFDQIAGGIKQTWNTRTDECWIQVDIRVDKSIGCPENDYPSHTGVDQEWNREHANIYLLK